MIGLLNRLAAIEQGSCDIDLTESHLHNLE